MSKIKVSKEELARLRYIEKCARKFINKAYDTREMPNIFDKTSRSFCGLKDALLISKAESQEVQE